MGVPRRKSSQEFKLELVRLARQGDQSLAQVARALGVRPEMLRRWKGQLGGLQGNLTVDERGELSQLRRENRRLKEERDILRGPRHGASPLEEPVVLTWDQVPRTGTGKVRRMELRELVGYPTETFGTGRWT